MVADARPEGEGRATLHSLLGAGIACTYVLLNSVPLVMQASRIPAIPHARTCIPINNSAKGGRVLAAVLTRHAAMPCLSLVGAASACTHVDM